MIETLGSLSVVHVAARQHEQNLEDKAKVQFHLSPP